MPDVLGYARVSTAEQDLEVQRRRLRDEAKAIRIFEDVVSGKSFDRPGLATLIDYARPGDIVCVVRLDRLGRSLKELLETVDGFKRRGLEFRSLEERLDLVRHRRTRLSCLRGDRPLRAAADRRANQGWDRRRPVTWQTPRPPAAR